MLCTIKFDVKNHFTYSFQSNASINKFKNMSVEFCQEKD